RGNRVALRADRGGILPPGPADLAGIAPGGPLPLGYLGDPERTRQTFPVIDGVRYCVGGDRGRYTADGRVLFLGRDAVCINTGGEKVVAEEVERIVKSHPAVYDALVVRVRSERWGQQVTALVSIMPGARRQRSPSSAPTAQPSSPTTRCRRRSWSCRRSSAVRAANPTTSGRRTTRAAPRRRDGCRAPRRAPRSRRGAALV